MLLVIDVSNTNMVLGVFHGENLVANWRLSTKSGRTADETGLLICSLFAYSDVSVGDIEAIIVSSVVPDVMYSTLNGIKKFLKKDPIVVRAGLKTCGWKTRRKWGQTVLSTLWRRMSCMAALPLWWIMKPQPHLMLSARRANF